MLKNAKNSFKMEPAKQLASIRIVSIEIVTFAKNINQQI